MSILSTTSTPISTLLGGGRPTVSGLSTGLDTEKIIQGLLAIQQQRITDLQNKQTKVQQQQAAFKEIEGRLLNLQNQATQLGRAQNGVFDGRTTTSSATDLVTAAASSSAVPGVYTLRVNSLAQAQQIASQGFDSPVSAITHGTFQIQAGAGATAGITIDSSNDTVQGLANAINNAGVGVAATVVNDGSPSHTQPIRLLLTANNAGSSNSILITNNLAADSGSAVKPVFDAPFVGVADIDPGYTGTATPSSNYGGGSFSGASNNTYTFTVLTSGTVGTDNNLQIAYSDSAGVHTGTVTINAADADVFKTVAEGVQVKLSAGTLVAGQTFTIKGSVPVVQQAANASVTIGSGSGALSVQSASNQIDGLFSGVTLNLQGADPGRTVTVTVASDTASAKKAVEDFVSGFNDLMQDIDTQVHYDAASADAGPLLGNRQVIAMQDQLRNAVVQPIAGLKPQMNRLSALGISPDDHGHLTVDENKLDNALNGGIAGVTWNDVRSLFALAGASSNPAVQFAAGSDRTKASASPYQVSVTQAAQRASITATNSLAAATVIADGANTFTISVDGAASGTITLTPGMYSGPGLAQELTSRINAAAGASGRKVTVSLNGDKLQVASASYGALSSVTIGSGAALTALGFAGTETGLGTDVVGAFVVNGVAEPASGTGQLLIGSAANANTSGLQVRVALSAAQVGGGFSTDLTVTRGIGSLVGLALTGLLDPVSGRLRTIDDGFRTNLQTIQDDIDRQNRLMDDQRTSLLKQFTAMETTVSQLQSIGNYVATQFASLTKSGG